VVLHPNQDRYIRLKTLDMDSTVQKILDRRMGKNVFDFSEEVVNFMNKLE